MQLQAKSSLITSQAGGEDPFGGPTPATTFTNKGISSPKPKKLIFPRRSSIDLRCEGSNNQWVDASTGTDDEAISSVFTWPSRRSPAEKKIFEYFKRVAELRTYVAQDGNELNRESEEDFWLFVVKEFGFRKGNLVVTDNRNLRIVWKDGQGTHLGLQFLGGGEVQYVIFKRRAASQKISRVAGRDSVEGVKSQIDSFELSTLLNE